ncbi:MAG: acyl transferase [Cytophagales bacterium]|nr:acyl transferase [Cytophagales bacterium]
MSFSDSFKKDIYQIEESSFEAAAVALFDYQWHENELYQSYCKHLSKNPTNVRQLTDIPFLPISFFKSHQIQSGKWRPKKVFKSSGTGNATRSQHLVKDLDFYLENTIQSFESIYGSLNNYQIRALLPSYQEQGDSSLIAMVDHFMSRAPASAYYLKRDEELIEDLQSNKNRALLIGVSFALLDLAEKHRLDLTNQVIMETGGMKGRRNEMIREELHQVLQQAFSVEEIHSEYGMCELFTQAYAPRKGIFQFPNWAKVMIRDINDPFVYLPHGRTGGVNIIDMANVDSCAFIETKDLGKPGDKGTFEILGRFDNSDIRGCNLLI